MGLVPNSTNVRLFLQPIETALMSALTTAAERVKSGQADDAITRWLGAGAVAQRAGLAGTINKFRSNINIKSITVGFEGLQKNPSYVKGDKKTPAYNRDESNAAAYAAPDLNVSLHLGDMLSHVPKGQTPVFLGTTFRTLPLYMPLAHDGRIDNSGWIQSQFETVVHELSHLLLGTEDVKFGSGETAYGSQYASHLATFGSEFALKNAENWGMFIEAAGVHKTS